jgi:hypothetical protein
MAVAQVVVTQHLLVLEAVAAVAEEVTRAVMQEQVLQTKDLMEGALVVNFAEVLEVVAQGLQVVLAH